MSCSKQKPEYIDLLLIGIWQTDGRNLMTGTGIQVFYSVILSLVLLGACHPSMPLKKNLFSTFLLLIFSSLAFFDESSNFLPPLPPFFALSLSSSYLDFTFSSSFLSTSHSHHYYVPLTTIYICLLLQYSYVLLEI